MQDNAAAIAEFLNGKPAVSVSCNTKRGISPRVPAATLQIGKDPQGDAGLNPRCTPILALRLI
jgi:hypothetical protein